jgi:hypothetical protein
MELLDEALFERVIHWVAEREGEANLLAARQRFEELTGAIAETDPDHESRMLHMFECWLCEAPAQGDGLVAQFAAAHTLSDDEQRQLAGWQRSHRSLFEFEGFDADGAHLRDLLLHGRYRVWPATRDRELKEGDRFDARIVPGRAGLWLSPGRVYHARMTFPALDRLLREPALSAFAHKELLDGLLRMRSRFVRFASIRPEHVFCLDGFSASAFAAPWATPAHRRNHQPRE